MTAIFRKTTCFLASGILIFGLSSQVSGQSVGLPAPRLLTTTPMGGKVGGEVEIAITGDFLDDAGELIFSDSRIKATPKKDAEGKVVPDKYQVKIDKACPPGLYEARIMTRLGISSSRVFVVGTLDEILETKPNNTLASAIEMPVNSVCNGTVADRAIDFLAFQAKKGQRLIVDCATRGIDSKLNATVIIGDEAGRDLVVERRGGVLDFTAPKDGKYTIKIHELTFKGGPAFYYRLGLWEQKPGTPIERQATTRAVNAFSWPPEGLATAAATTEAEPNVAVSKIQKITLPADIGGSFFPAADVDVYEFNAKKGETWWVELASERLGRPTDASALVQKVVKSAEGEKLVDVLELTDIASPVKVSSNGYAYDGPPYNSGTSDFMGKLEIKEDGVYRLQVTDLFGGTRSDPANQYRLVIRKPEPDFALVSWAIHMELRNGDRNALSKPIALRGGATMALEVVAMRRDGFDGDINLTMTNLPRGVRATGLRIPAGKSYGLMLITADESAPRGYANATFTGTATMEGKPVSHPVHYASVAWPIPDSWGEIPSPRLVTDVPVSVSGIDKAPLTITAKSPKFEVKAGEKLTIPLVLTRRSDFSGDKIQVRSIGAGFDSGQRLDVSIKADTADVVLDLAKLKTPPGEYQVSFLGGAVAKYRHQPDAVAKAEATSQKQSLEVKQLEAEVKKLMDEAKAAPAEKKEQVQKTMASMNSRMKAATDALNVTKQQLKRATDAATPRDIADIVVCEPITIVVKPAEKK